MRKNPFKKLPSGFGPCHHYFFLFQCYELVKLMGHFRRFIEEPTQPGTPTDDDHDNLSVKSGWTF
jgi:hypothetical protein